MLEEELQKIYDSEINVSISWFWDGWIDVRLGDQMNGFLAEENVRFISEIVPWLQEAIAHFYPNSTYALGLDEELRKRATQRLILPPQIGARVECTHCGAPYANPARMEEISAFVCPRCGEGVKVEPPRPQ